jgi:hypothetical protein
VINVAVKVLSGLGRIFLKPPSLLILLVVSAAGAGYFYYRYDTVQSEYENFKNDPRAIAREDVLALIEKVGRLTTLPEGESPTIATVNDAELLSAQPFFKNAKVGDRILIYSESKRAILYRPDTDKIIEFANLNLTSRDGIGKNVVKGDVAGKADEVKEPLKLAVYNSTQESGLTVRVTDHIGKTLTEFEFETVDRGNAVGSYETTLVVVLNADYTTEAASLANALNAAVEDLPEEEDVPEADVLVIVADDFIDLLEE